MSASREHEPEGAPLSSSILEKFYQRPSKESLRLLTENAYFDYFGSSILAKGATFDLIYRAGHALCDYLRKGDLPAALELISDIPEGHFASITGYPFFCLHEAISGGHLDCARILVEKGGDVNLLRSDFRREAPLHVAASSGHADCVKMLIEMKADVNILDGNGNKPLYVAMRDTDCANLLVESMGTPSIFDCVILGNVTLLNACLSAIPEDKRMKAINTGDVTGRTPAYLAAVRKVVIDDKEVVNPCLKALIYDHGAVFLSKQEALLNEKEKHILFFAVVFIAIFAAAAIYLSLSFGQHVTTTCDTIYDGLLQVPYLYAIISIFFFKIFQFLFERMLVPALDFLSFAADHWLERSLTSYKPCKDSFRACLINCARMRCGSDKVEDATTIEDDIHDDLAFADVESPVRTKAAVVSAPHSLSSRLLYSIFGHHVVMAWRHKKYLDGEKTDLTYKGSDFYYQSPYLFLYLQTCWAFVSFFMATINVDRSLSSWQQYTNFYAIVLNSGVVTQMTSTGFLLKERFEQFSHLPRTVQLFLSTPFLLILPPILTHILPAGFLYQWVQVLVILLQVAFYRNDLLTPFFRQVGIRGNLSSYLISVFIDITFRFCFAISYRTFFSYAHHIYLQGIPITGDTYISAITYEFHLSSQTKCFLERSWLITLFSWF